jgi:sensor histidine kinase YesM
MIMFNMDNFGKNSNYSFWTHITILNFITFYLGYFFLVPWIMRRKKLSGIIVVSILWLIGMTMLRSGINYLVMEVLNIWEKVPFSIEKQLTMVAFNTLIYSSNAILIYFSIEWYKERQFRSELVKEKQKSEIGLLRSQINPHFFMNTLNNLYSLVYQGSPRASDAVHKLSDIMRYMLYETTAETVPLENEVKYLRSFIELELLRFKNQER